MWCVSTYGFPCEALAEDFGVFVDEEVLDRVCI